MSKKKTKPEPALVPISKKLTGRGLRTVYVYKRDVEKIKKRVKNRCRVRVVIDGKAKAVDPMAVLFGPAHRDVNPKAECDWSPENHKEWTKKWTK